MKDGKVHLGGDRDCIHLLQKMSMMIQETLNNRYNSFNFVVVITTKYFKIFINLNEHN